MTMFFLIRHASHFGFGEFLTGRSGAQLNEKGTAQARNLALKLKAERLACVQASPRERARETAEYVAQTCGRTPVEISSDLDEVDFGSWSGQAFTALANDPTWQRWNEQRSEARTPAGECMLDVQRRVVDHIARLASEMRGEAVALVTHAEVIRAALLHALELSLDHWSKFEIGPASITKVAQEKWGLRVIAVNEGAS
ncbi:MAG: histidine phosphatase family protein [Hyphomicrobiales bacterium]|nr:histidine phosphatase family protein [Hyphomicrobiales bacterium]